MEGKWWGIEEELEGKMGVGFGKNEFSVCMKFSNNK